MEKRALEVVARLGNKKKALVYGSGAFYEKHRLEVREEYDVLAFLDTFREGEKENLPLYKLHRTALERCECEAILIMVENTCAFLEIVNLLRDFLKEEELEKIIWGVARYEWNIECGRQKGNLNSLLVLPNEKLRISIHGISLNVSTEDEMVNVLDTLLNQCYFYVINNGKNDIVIDVGMNVGDSVLYFLHNRRVEKVYGYEPFGNTFLNAMENLEEYLDGSRLEIHQYGLSSKSERRTLKVHNGMTCGQSTDNGSNERALKAYADRGGCLEQGKKESVEVKNASEEIGKIVNKHPGKNIVLKMDCEGEEYGIMQVLSEHGVLQSIRFMMLEWHYRGKDFIIDILHGAGFSYHCHDKSLQMGLIYAWKGDYI